MAGVQHLNCTDGQASSLWAMERPSQVGGGAAENMTKDGLRKWMWVVLGSLFAVQFYFVRELLSALLLFAMGFAAIFSMITAMYLVLRAWEAILAGMRKTARPVLGVARRGLVFAEELSRKPFRRPRSEPVQ